MWLEKLIKCKNLIFITFPFPWSYRFSDFVDQFSSPPSVSRDQLSDSLETPIGRYSWWKVHLPTTYNQNGSSCTSLWRIDGWWQISLAAEWWKIHCLKTWSWMMMMTTVLNGNAFSRYNKQSFFIKQLFDGQSVYFFSYWLSLPLSLFLSAVGWKSSFRYLIGNISSTEGISLFLIRRW